MENLSKLSDEMLLKITKDLAARERELTLNVLHHLREVERRQLFAVQGYSSLFEYAVKELAYSEGAAHRRIVSMRLLKSLPQLESRIESGTLPLSTLSQAQSFFRQEKITEPEAKLDLLAQLEGKSSREVEKVLVLASSSPEKRHPERLRPISEDLHHLSLTVDWALLDKMDELRALLSHRNPGMGLKDLLVFTVEESLQKHRVKTPKAPTSELVPESLPTLEVEITNQAATTDQENKDRRRYVPVEIKRQVWFRDGGQCSYVDQSTGRHCASRHLLELDHIQPVARGGVSTPANLRLRCATHNRLAAIKVFGHETIQRYVPRMGAWASVCNLGT